nr:hypothetical protein [Marinicella sp. W31]MDC2878122.1 hypothetical protein [Marinicella sp. W31]
MVQIELFSKAPAIHDPNEILIERFTRLSFGICHRRVLDFDHDARWSDDVGAVNFAIRCGPRSLSALFGKQVFPSPMPLRLVLPPGIAVATECVRPVVYDAGAAFRDHGSAASWTNTLHARFRFATFIIDKGELHMISLVQMRKSGVGSACDTSSSSSGQH